MGEGSRPNALGKEKKVHPAGQAIQFVDLQKLPGCITKETLRLYFFFLFYKERMSHWLPYWRGFLLDAVEDSAQINPAESSFDSLLNFLPHSLHIRVPSGTI